VRNFVPRVKRHRAVLGLRPALMASISGIQQPSMQGWARPCKQ